MNDSYVFFITCASGFENALCEELNEIYEGSSIAAEVEIGSAGCYVRSSFAAGILANLSSFCASRVLLVLLECDVFDEQNLYQSVRDLDWPHYFEVSKTFSVKANVSQSFMQNSMYLSLKVKDALCDKFTEVLTVRPDVDIKHPDVKVFVRLVRDKLSISLDTSGDPLFMRGYKQNSNEAPVKETLAASLLRISGWNKLANSILNSSEPVYFERVLDEMSAVEAQRKIPKNVLLSPFFRDQFCGSGTIVVEAALALLHFNPNCLREKFSFMNLFPTEQEEISQVFKNLKERVLQKKKNILEIKEAIKAYAQNNKIEYKGSSVEGYSDFFPLQGSDINKATLVLAKEVALKAGVLELIDFSCEDAIDTLPHASCGLILINPPYGERMGASTDLTLLYKKIGDSWKKNYSNWTAWILSSNEDLTKSVGLRSTRKFSVYNGNLECRFLQYVMYPIKSV